jgi:hypothetical protein
MIHTGSCHCGQVRFEAEGEIEAGVSCNCSICSRKGALLWAVDADKFRILGAGQGLGEYRFGKRTMRHRFCRNCGIATHSEGEGFVAVNIRCIEGLDASAVKAIEFDGRSA